MTLIATAIAPYGVVHASDSNLTPRSGGPVAPGKKVFRLHFADAALAISGKYGVGTTPMDVWMPRAIAEYGATMHPTLAGFATDLGQRLSKETVAAKPDPFILIHIAGYVEESGISRPEFYFVRNVEDIDTYTGGYVGLLDHFEVDEQFLARDYLRSDVKRALAEGGTQRYFSGFPDGRIAYLDFVNRLNGFLKDVWAANEWKFRKPERVGELASFLDVEIRLIAAMFESSDYPAAYIGGEVQVVKIPAPANVLRL